MQKYVIILVAVGILYGCGSKQEDVKIEIGRMERTLFSIPIDTIAAFVPGLEQEYGELFDLYNQKIICIGSSKDPGYSRALTDFLTDFHMNQAYKKVSEVYSDVSDIEKGLSKSFSIYHSRFPDRAVPSVYTLISGFNQSMITADTILAIALDKYLGGNEEMYLRLNLAYYQRRLMDKKYIVPDCMKAWGYTEFPFSSNGNDNILSNILYEGKIAYYTHQMLPDTPDSLIFGYTPAQMHWCRENTWQMWTFLVEKKLLFSTDYLTINKLTGPAPFTSLFTQESPGRAVVWLGYKIIESYMRNNKSVTLEELLLNEDYQNILAKAKFKN